MAYEYLRALRYELRALPRFDRVQVCSAENGNYLLSFVPGLRGRIDDNRAGIATSRYEFRATGREPETMLFLGSFRHPPNQEGLNWFTQKVLPAVLEHKPQARLVIVGSEPPPRHSLPCPARQHRAARIRGGRARAAQPLCRIRLSDFKWIGDAGEAAGGVRGWNSGGFDTAGRGRAGRRKMERFVPWRKIRLNLRGRSSSCSTIQNRARSWRAGAREQVVATRDMRVLTERLVESYRQVLREKRR